MGHDLALWHHVHEAAFSARSIAACASIFVLVLKKRAFPISACQTLLSPFHEKNVGNVPLRVRLHLPRATFGWMEAQTREMEQLTQLHIYGPPCAPHKLFGKRTLPVAGPSEEVMPY